MNNNHNGEIGQMAFTGIVDNGDEESKVLIEKTHQLFSQVKPVPFEVDVPEYI